MASFTYKSPWRLVILVMPVIAGITLVATPVPQDNAKPTSFAVKAIAVGGALAAIGPAPVNTHGCAPPAL